MQKGGNEGNSMKKKIVLALAALLALGLFGCKGKDEQQGEQVASKGAKDYVYKTQDLKLSDNEYNGSSLLQAGDKILAYEYSWAEDGSGSTIDFGSLDENGNKTALFQIVMEESESCNNFDSDGESLYAIRNRSYYTGEQDAETGELIGEEGEYVDEYHFVKFTLQGEEVFSTRLNDIPELKQIEEENGYFGAYSLIAAGDYVYFNCCGNYVQMDKDGNFVKVIGNFENEENNSIGLYKLLDGRVVAVIWSEKDMSIALADMEKGTLGEKTVLPGISYNYSFYAGMGYDLYLTDTYGMYGYNIGDGDKTQLLNYVDSDMDSWGISNIIPIDEKSFFGIYDSMDGGRNVAKFTKVEPEDVKDKQIITLAMAYTNWNVRSEIIKFNKSSEEYRIQIQDYSSMYNTMEDNNIGLTKLNADIASGKIPDIILLDDQMPIDSYMNKGLFEDLRPYIEKDADLDINQFMPNIIEACSKDGKLQILVPYFSVNTLIAKSRYVGSERGWTVQEAVDIWKSMPEGTEFLNSTTRSSMLETCIRLSASQFIDWETGKCSFDGDGFIQMLEFVNTFPEEINEEEYFTDNYWENYDSMWREDRVLTSQLYLGDFKEFNRQEKGTFGEEVTMIGFPSADGDGSVIMPGLEIVMSAKSQVKEGAWSFMRNFLMDEYQSNIYGFPLSIEHLEKLAKEAMEKNYYEDENGKRIEYDDVYYMDGMEVVIEPMTEQETKDLMDELYSFTQIYRYDDALNQIINEEAAAFFAGQKSAKDVAGIIQSRAQIYVNETR